MNTTPKSPPDAKLTPEMLEKSEEANLLWDEYKYRHDLIWRHIIRSTLVLVALITVRYTKEFGGDFYLSLVAWFLAIVYIGFTILVVDRELQLYNQIKDLHRKRQRFYFGLFSEHSHDQATVTANFFDKSVLILKKFFARMVPESFSKRVMVYLTVLLLLVILAGPISLCNDQVEISFAC